MVLKEARKIIETQWGRSIAYNYVDEEYCAVGAILKAAGSDDVARDTYNPSQYDYLFDPFEMTKEELWKFNDTHTQQEILDLFDEVICVTS